MKYTADILSEIQTWCHYADTIEEIEYGALYNWYAATDARNICADGWHVPTSSDIKTLGNYLSGSYWDDPGCNLVYGFDDIGIALMSSEIDSWNNPGNDLYGLGLKGSGIRVDSGFSALMEELNIWMSDITSGCLGEPDGSPSCIFLYDSYDGFISGYSVKYYGKSLRLLKDTTTLTHGQTGTYIGNDGKVYRTICIGTQEWLADNLAETKYRNGDAIPIVTDNAAWVALITGAMCYYNNDISNA